MDSTYSHGKSAISSKPFKPSRSTLPMIFIYEAAGLVGGWNDSLYEAIEVKKESKVLRSDLLTQQLFYALASPSTKLRNRRQIANGRREFCARVEVHLDFNCSQCQSQLQLHMFASQRSLSEAIRSRRQLFHLPCTLGG